MAVKIITENYLFTQPNLTKGRVAVRELNGEFVRCIVTHVREVQYQPIKTTVAYQIKLETDPSKMIGPEETSLFNNHRALFQKEIQARETILRLPPQQMQRLSYAVNALVALLGLIAVVGIVGSQNLIPNLSPDAAIAITASGIIGGIALGLTAYYCRKEIYPQLKPVMAKMDKEALSKFLKQIPPTSV